MTNTTKQFNGATARVSTSYDPDNYLSEQDVDAMKHATNASRVESLIKILSETKVKLGTSTTHGVGVFAVADIKEGATVFQFNGNPKFGATLDLLPEKIDLLPPHVGEMIKCFFLRNADGSYPVPEVGLVGGLGIDKYLNSSRPSGDVGSSKGNVMFGNKIDESGYLEGIAIKDIPVGEELLVDYHIQDCQRQSRPRDDGVITCRYCLCEIVRGTKGVIDLECYCTDGRWSHLECAKKWYAKRAMIKFIPHYREDGSPRQIWEPSISVDCDVCKKNLSNSFIDEIIKMLANGRMCKIRDVANQILSKEKVLLNTKIVKPDNGGTGRKGSGRKGTTSVKRKGLDESDNRVCYGFLSNKKAQFYMEDDRKWIHGCIHEYVSAAKRKKDRCSCKPGEECSCPNLRRGIYRYTFRNQFGALEVDYFSDEDDTVRVHGLSGSDLWG